jgi:hypothetical protein
MSLLVNFALNMENNDSRLVGIPKREFVSVISGILNPSKENGGNGNGEDDEDFDANDEKIKLNTAARRQPFTGPSDFKRDSFYFLQRTLERRDQEIAGKFYISYLQGHFIFNSLLFRNIRQISNGI